MTNKEAIEILSHYGNYGNTMTYKLIKEATVVAIAALKEKQKREKGS